MMRLVLRLCAGVLLTMSLEASAMLTTMTITSVEPLAPGSTFGSTGAYERVKGTFSGELDPRDPRNRVIVNIENAPRNAAGNVEYEADFFMLRPADSNYGNNKIIYDVTNRGRKNFHSRFMDAKRASN